MSAITPSAAYASDNLSVRMDVDRLKKGRLLRSMPREEAIIFGDLVGKLRIAACLPEVRTLGAVPR